MNLEPPQALSLLSSAEGDTQAFVLATDLGEITGALAGHTPVPIVGPVETLVGLTLAAAAVGTVVVRDAAGDVVLEVRPGEQARRADLVIPDTLTSREAAKDQYGKPGYEFEKANLEDFVLTERRTVDLRTQPLAFGSLHPKNSRLKLIGQKLTDGENGKRVQVLVWSANLHAGDQKDYGWSVSHPYALKEYPRVTWNLRILAADYGALEWSQGCLVSGFETLTLTAENYQVEANGVFGTLGLTYDTLPGPEIVTPIFLETGLVGTKTTQTVLLAGANVAGGALVESGAIEPQTALVGSKSGIVTPYVAPLRQTTRQQVVQIPDKFLEAGSYIETETYTVGASNAAPLVLGTVGQGRLSSMVEQIREDRARFTNRFLKAVVATDVTEYSTVGGVVVRKDSYWGTNDGAPEPSAYVSETVTVLGDGAVLREKETKTEIPLLPGSSVEQAWIPPEEHLVLTAIRSANTLVISDAVAPLPVGTNGIGVRSSKATQTEKFLGSRSDEIWDGQFLEARTYYERNGKGQLVTITQDVGEDLTLPAWTERSQIGQIKLLGKTNKVMRIYGESATFFEEKSWSVEHPRLAHEVRAFAGVVRFSQLVPGTASSPVNDLQAGEDARSRTQVTEQYYKDTVDQFASKSVSWTHREFVPSLNTTATTTNTYEAYGGLTVDNGTGVLKSEVQTLTKAGDQLKTSETVEPAKIPVQTGGQTLWAGVATKKIWPRLDPSTEVNQVLGAEVEVVPEGSFSRKSVTKFSPAAYGFKTFRAIPLPRVLETIKVKEVDGEAPLYFWEFSGGHTVRVEVECVVTFSTGSGTLETPVTQVTEAAITTPTNREYGLTPSGVELIFFGTNAFRYAMPTSSPSSQQWQTWRRSGTRVLLDTEVSESRYSGWLEMKRYYGKIPKIPQWDNNPPTTIPETF